MDNPKSDKDLDITARINKQNAYSVFWGKVGVFGFGVSIFFFLLLFLEQDTIYPAIITFLLAFASLFISAYFSSKSKGIVNDDIVLDLLNERFNVLVFDRHQSINPKILLPYSLTPSWNKHRGNDYIKGIYKNTQFEYCDLYLCIHYPGDDSSTSREVQKFRGQFLAFDIKVNFESALILRENKRNPDGSYVGGKSNVDTGDEVFNARYSVTCLERKQAETIFTKEFKEKLWEINNKSSGKLNVCLDKNKAYVLIDNNYDNFELRGKNDEIADLSILRHRFRCELNLISDTLDAFIQNEHI